MRKEKTLEIIAKVSSDYPFESMQIHESTGGLVITSHYKGKERTATVPHKGLQYGEVWERAKRAFDKMLDQ